MFRKKLFASILTMSLVTGAFLGCSFIDGLPYHSAGKTPKEEAMLSNDWEYRDRLFLPGYFRNHLKSKLAEIKQVYSAENKNQEIFVFFTDYHIEENQGYSPLIIKELQKELPLSMIVFGGDIYDAGPEQAQAMAKMEHFQKRFAFAGDKWQQVIGNHEYNTCFGNRKARPQAFIDNARLQNKLLAKQLEASGGHNFYGDYWLDKGDMRYFFVGATSGEKVREAQCKWLFTEFAKVPDGKNIMLFSHIGCVPSLPKGRIDNSFMPITQALSMVKHGKNFVWHDETYAYNSKKVQVVGCMTGHVHWDDMATANGIKVTATISDTLRYNPTKEQLRKPGTISEQIMDVVVIDKAQRKVNLFRIGYGKNRSFKY